MANADPKNALTAIKKIQESSKELDKEEKMRTLLVKYKAEDKCYIPHKSDSTIMYLYNYFQNHGSNYEKLQCLYYIGSTYRDMQDYPSSIIWYEKALEQAESVDISRKDSLTLALVHSQIADVLYKIGDKKGALEQEKSSYEIQQKIGTTTFSTMEDMGRFYDDVGVKDSAAKYYKKALVDIINQNKCEEYIDYLGEQLGFYTYTGMIPNANLVLSIIKSCKIPDNVGNVYSAIAFYYSKRGIPDSTLIYTKEALKTEKDIRTRGNLSKDLARLLSQRGDLSSAYKYAMASLDLLDSADMITNANGVINAKNQMTLLQLQKDRSFKKDAERQKVVYLSFIIIAILLLVTITFIFLYISSKRKLKYQTNIQRISNEKDKISADHISLKNRIDADRQLRSESALDVSTVIKHLQDLSDDPKMKLQPDSWDVIFNVVDKIHPYFRDYLLSCCPDLENKDLILLYLMKLGFKQADVSRIIKRNPSVVSRRLRRIESLVGIPVKEALRDKQRNDINV